jgi:hypothetical protein
VIIVAVVIDKQLIAAGVALPHRDEMRDAQARYSSQNRE